MTYWRDSLASHSLYDQPSESRNVSVFDQPPGPDEAEMTDKYELAEQLQVGLREREAQYAASSESTEARCEQMQHELAHEATARHGLLLELAEQRTQNVVLADATEYLLLGETKSHKLQLEHERHRSEQMEMVGRETSEALHREKQVTSELRSAQGRLLTRGAAITHRLNDEMSALAELRRGRCEATAASYQPFTPTPAFAAAFAAQMGPAQEAIKRYKIFMENQTVQQELVAKAKAEAAAAETGEDLRAQLQLAQRETQDLRQQATDLKQIVAAMHAAAVGARQQADEGIAEAQSKADAEVAKTARLEAEAAAKQRVEEESLAKDRKHRSRSPRL